MTQAMELDLWQKEVVQEILKGEKDICVRSGRQCGKSTCIAIGVGEFAVSQKGKGDIIVISHTEKQAYLLFSKIRDYLLDKHKDKIKKPHTRNITKSEINLVTGISVRCLPCGTDGTTLRGYTAKIVVADEAAYMGTAIFDAVVPTLSVTKGKLVLLSTPKGIGNFFYDSYNNPSFKTWHVSSEDSPRISKEFLEEQKRTKTKLVYRQEYLGEFTSDLRQVFSDELIKSVQVMDRGAGEIGIKYMGCDIAHMGGDECVFSIGRTSGDTIYHMENYVTENILIPDTISKIQELDKAYNCKKIYIDTGGMGVAVFDFLLRNDQTRGKVVAINNATRPIERNKFEKQGRRRELMKEHLYMNLKRLMEQGKIHLLKDDNIFYSLKSVQAEITDSGDLKIFGTYTHIAEALIRLAWSSQEKSINPFVIGL